MAGKVDDAEVRIDADGIGWVDALLTGPASLPAGWATVATVAGASGSRRALDAGDDRRSRIPISQVTEVTATVHIAVDADELASHGSEDWVDRHIIAHIPGADRGE